MQSGKMKNTERQPLLTSASEPSHTDPLTHQSPQSPPPPARPDIRSSPESTLVDVQSEDDGMKKTNHRNYEFGFYLFSAYNGHMI